MVVEGSGREEPAAACGEPVAPRASQVAGLAVHVARLAVDHPGADENAQVIENTGWKTREKLTK